MTTNPLADALAKLRAEVEVGSTMLLAEARASLDRLARAEAAEAERDRLAAANAQLEARVAGLVEAKPRKLFPILKGEGARIDYQLVADHAEQARKNHYQSVERLAERGGLSWCELYAVLHNREWKKIDDNEAIIACRALEARYLAAHGKEPTWTTDPLADALAKLRSVTAGPAMGQPWETANFVSDTTGEAFASVVATILNAALSGDLMPRSDHLAALAAANEAAAGAVVQALWPVLGGNHTEADEWHRIADAVQAAIRTPDAPASADAGRAG